MLPLADGDDLEFYGRIDRIDVNGGGAESLLDYKTQAAKVIAERLSDDIQLPSYALLHGEAAQAAYVALDDDRGVSTVASGADDAPLSVQAQAQGERLRTAFTALRARAPLPAHGVAGVCEWCAMSGLCRKDHVQS